MNKGDASNGVISLASVGLISSVMAIGSMEKGDKCF